MHEAAEQLESTCIIDMGDGLSTARNVWGIAESDTAFIKVPLT